SGMLAVPAVVELERHPDGDRLVWRGRDGDRLSRFVRPGDGLLREFVSLTRDRSGERILTFARSWGVLDICQHGLPWSHAPGSGLLANLPVLPDQFPAPEFRRACFPLGFTVNSGGGWEPVEVWRAFARQATVLLDVAARLHLGKPVHAEHWDQVSEGAGQVA